MAAQPSFLVVGGDSLVGGGVTAALRRRGLPHVVSTRRAATTSSERVFLDFASDVPFTAPAGIDYALVIAAATNYDRCETDPRARVTNVEMIPRVIGSLLAQGLFVSFISTNSVFGGERPWPEEDAPHAPVIAYARQKSEGEAAVRAAAEGCSGLHRLNIVRLTKILDASVSPIPAWLAAWDRGQRIKAFSDFTFAPMSVKFVGEALATIGETRIAGNLHLSGAENITYVDFARTLAEQLGVVPELVEVTTANEMGVNIPFKPRYSGLGMTRTTQLTRIQPQHLDAVIGDIVDDVRTDRKKHLMAAAGVA